MFNPVGRMTANGSTSHHAKQETSRSGRCQPAVAPRYRLQSDVAMFLSSLPMVRISTTAHLENALMRMPMAGGEAAELVAAVAALGSAYALGKEGIYFIRPTGQESGQELASFALR